MNVIVDAYNLMYRLELKGTLEEKREKLISLLSEFLNVNGGSMTVVFDGRNNPSHHRGADKRGRVRIIYSAQGETADDIIMEMTDKRSEKARTYVIVTSDNRIRKYAAERQIRSITSDEFEEYLT